MTELQKSIESLVKTLEAGNYNTAPGTRVQGSALQVENLDPVMHNVTFDDSHIKLQKMFPVKKSKSVLIQFRRQLSYGRFGASAQREGAVGSQQVGDYVDATVGMCYYSHQRRTTMVADLIETVDGKKGTDRQAEDAAMLLAGDIEFHAFAGKDDFSNAGLFDGNPDAIADVPDMLGFGVQIRMSDVMVNTQDLMFNSFGSNRSVVLPQNGGLDQVLLSQMQLRSRLNMGNANDCVIAPEVLEGYNRRTAGYGSANTIQRIVLGGSAQDASGSELRRQFGVFGTVSLEDSRFLSGKTTWLRPIPGSAPAPTITTQPAATNATANIPAGAYIYVVTAWNENGEGNPTICNSVTVAANQEVTIVIAAQASATHFAIYRGASAATAGFIGNVKANAFGATTFIDLGNRLPASSKGYLVQKDTAEFHEMLPFSKVEMAVKDLSKNAAFARFLTLAVTQPRKSVIADNLIQG